MVSAISLFYMCTDLIWSGKEHQSRSLVFAGCYVVQLEPEKLP